MVVLARYANFPIGDGIRGKGCWECTWPQGESKMKLFSYLAVAAMGLALVSSSLRADDEQKIKPEDLPQAVKDAVKKRFANMEIAEAAREKEKDKVVFEVTLKRNQRTIDATYTEAGELVSTEELIKQDALPTAVKTVILAKYPGAKMEKIERITTYADNSVKDLFFEVLMQTADNKKLEVKLGAEWKIVETEAKDGKKD